MNWDGGEAMISQVAQHIQSSHTEIGVIQVPLVHWTITQSTPWILTLHDESEQSIPIDRNVVYCSKQIKSLLRMIIADSDHQL